VYRKLGEDFHITPWEVRGEVDYNRLIKMFGVKPIGSEVEDLMRKVFGEIPLHVRRRIFYSHRDLDRVLREYIDGKPFYLYTGRGPSGPMHLGHILPMIFTKYIQEKLDNLLLLQLTPDEKYMYHETMTKDEIYKYSIDNIRDILAVGFKPDKTIIVDDLRHIDYLYQLAVSVARKVTFSTARATFGFTGETNIGMIFYMAIQAAPCFLGYIIDEGYANCLIPAAIDQDPYWRVTRDIAGKLGFSKPSQIHGKLLPSLEAMSKMSTSEPETALYLSDPEEDVDRKIRNAFTGGQPTAELQRKYGGNPDICTVFTYYAFIFEENDKELRERYEACKTGRLLCGDCKAELIERINRYLVKHGEAKERIDRDVIEEYMLDNRVDIKEMIQNYDLLR
jgi:tryptophanyl-tRNA synthetase